MKDLQKNSTETLKKIPDHYTSKLNLINKELATCAEKKNLSRLTTKYNVIS